MPTSVADYQRVYWYTQLGLSEDEAAEFSNADLELMFLKQEVDS